MLKVRLDFGDAGASFQNGAQTGVGGQGGRLGQPLHCDIRIAGVCMRPVTR